jgi:RNA polymerase sigma factor (sigma-70 family)
MTGRPLTRLIARLQQTAAADGYPAADAELLRRFLSDRDPAAFEALVRRHGPAVLSACRKVLTDPADVEDAFQAAFLVLLRDAKGIRRETAVGSWLYGVAHRVALRVRAARRRRDTVESRAKPRPPASPPDLMWTEACGIVHEELDRLPDHYRLPLMLCYLEGLSRDEAAVQLGVTLNVVRNRLERGREKLRARLMRRGVALSAGLLAATAESAVATVPSELMAAVAKTAVRPAARIARFAAAGSGAVASKVAGSLVLALGVTLALGAVGAPPKDMPAKDDPKPKTEPKVVEGGKPVTFRGRVVGPDGKPVAGAKVWVVDPSGTAPKAIGPKAVATTRTDGRYEVTEDGKGRGQYWMDTAKLAATAHGFGVGWVNATDKTLEIRLVTDEPVKGRVLTLEGKPVAGATVRVLSAWNPNETDLGPWLKELKAGKYPFHEVHDRHFDHSRKLYQDGYPVPGQPETTVTDNEGRFTLRGLGRERLVELRIDGPTIASDEVRVFTRPDPAVRVPEDPGERMLGMRTYYGSTFDLAAEPTLPFEGVVTDRATSKPVAGVTVRARSKWWSIYTVTDKDGRYRLTGLPPGPHELIACPAPDQPYHRMMASGGRTATVKTVPLDFALTRGHWVTGKLINARTKKPEAKAPVWYFPFADEPAYDSVPGSRAWSLEPTTYTAEDGTFRVVAFACRGAVLANAFGGNAISAEQRPLQGDVGSLEKAQQVNVSTLRTSPAASLFSYHAALIVNVDPKKPVEYTMTVDPGATVTMKLVDLDGKPVTGAFAGGLSTWAMWSDEQKSAELTVTEFNPDRPRPMVVLHPGRGLGKLVRPKAGDLGPWEVKLEPTGTAAGRLVTEDGTPIPDAPLQVFYTLPGHDAWTPAVAHDKLTTDAEGKFRLANLVPGLPYTVRHSRETGVSQIRHFLNLELKAGEEKALGDVKPSD